MSQAAIPVEDGPATAQETDGNTVGIREHTTVVARSVISDRDYRTQERNASKCINIFDSECQRRQADRDVLTLEDVHQLLSAALRELGILKELQNVKYKESEEEEKEEWKQSIEITEDRIKNLMVKYEEHVKATMIRPPSESSSSRRQRSVVHAISRRGSRSSVSNSLASVTSSVRARMESEKQLIELAKKKKEMELRMVLARQRADFQVQEEELQLQLEVNETAALLQQTQVEARLLDEVGSHTSDHNVISDTDSCISVNNHESGAKKKKISHGPAKKQISHGPAKEPESQGPATEKVILDSEIHTTHILGSENCNLENGIDNMKIQAKEINPLPSDKRSISQLDKYPIPTLEKEAKRLHTHAFNYPEYRAQENTRPSVNYSSGVVDKLLQKQLLERKTEEMKFDGNPLNYLSFQNEFNLMIREFPDDPSYLFAALENYLSGTAKQDIRHCKDLLADPQLALRTALDVLHRNYGSEYEVRKAHLQQICDLNRPVEGDAASLRKLLSDLERCKVLLRYNQHSTYLNSPETIKAVVQRLPDHIQKNFVKSTNKLFDRSNPGFTFLLEFISKECDYASNPFADLLTSKKQSNKSSWKEAGARKPRIQRTHTATALDNVAVESGSTSQQVNHNYVGDGNHNGTRSKTYNKTANRSCIICKGIGHRLQDCSTFTSNTVEERWKLLEGKSGVCFSCLYSGHKSSARTSRYTCRKCHSKRHHTLLCRQTDSSKTPNNETTVSKTPNEDGTGRNSLSANTQGTFMRKSTYTRVLPLQALSDNGCNVKIYALLDSGSELTCATESLASKLKLTGPKTTLNLEGIHGVKKLDTMRVSFGVRSLNPVTEEIYYLDNVNCMSKLPAHRSSIPTGEISSRYAHLRDLEFPILSENQVDLIIGTDYEKLHETLESRYSDDSNLCAHRTPLGWLLAGTGDSLSVDEGNTLGATCNFCSIPFYGAEPCEHLLEAVRLMVDGIRESPDDECKSPSIEDEKVLKLFEEQVVKVNGHFQLPLPFRDPNVKLPNNYTLARSRFGLLEKRLIASMELLTFFKDKFTGYLQKEYLSPVDINKPVAKPDRIYYLPYFCTSQTKPRIVYDGSALHKGMSLNKALMSGPDLLQPLIDVLTRFRQDEVGFVCDLKEMFLQVKLAPEDQDSVRILWFEDGDVSKEVKVYKFLVHPFGLNSSPAVANYCLQKCADEVENVTKEMADRILKQFYMDDGLHSEESVDAAHQRLTEIKSLVGKANFKVAKVTSNSVELLNKLDQNELDSEIMELDLDVNKIPQHKTLGVLWDPDTDKLVVKVKVKERPTTKSGVFSMIGQLFDPYGVVQPYLLEAKLIMQEAFAGQSSDADSWKMPLPEQLQNRWRKWYENIQCLEQINIPRCYHINGSRPENYELHSFSDASTVAIGTVSYLRYQKYGVWRCSFVRGKSRIIPRNNHGSVARHELEAAVLGVRQHHDILKALDLPICREKSRLWSDSTTVLTWISQTSRRAKAFVANRRRVIHRLSKIEEWKYVQTDKNPADMATRGISPAKATLECPWIKGPEFLSHDEPWHMKPTAIDNNVDMEWATTVKTVSTMTTGLQAKNSKKESDALPLYSLLWQYSDITKLKRRVAWLKRFKAWFQKKPISSERLSLLELESSLVDIIRLSQSENFTLKVMHNIKEHGWTYTIEHCMDKCIVSQLKAISKLSPYIDNDGLLRVGGRLQEADIPDSRKHPYILPKRHHVTRLLVEEAHCRLGHFGGAQQAVAVLQQQYWITVSAAQFYLHRCVTCEQLRAKSGKQVMAPLPSYRVAHGGAPFKVTGVDYFGPIMVRVNRGSQKRWIALFTCMATRGIHMEVVHGLTSSSFLQALFRFNNSHGNPLRTLVSDNATTFHGAHAELKDALIRLDCEETHKHLEKRSIEWKFNPPLASHQGGAWERLIRSVRKILSGLPAFGRTMPRDESLLTVIKEAESIMNNRPLTQITGEADEFLALTPSMIMYGHLGNNSPYGILHSADELKADWRYTQVAAEQFWNRFVREYLSYLQKRPKWYTSERNLNIGEMVLIRNEGMVKQDYPRALITEVFRGKDGNVRSVEVRLADGRRFVRDIRKIIPLELANGSN